MNRIVTNKTRLQSGFSLVELLIVLLVVAIIVVLALPQVLTTRRLLKFSGVQMQILTSLREARQDAINQRAAVTFRYDDTTKKVIFYGGGYGPVGDSKNRVIEITGDGVAQADVIYGRPAGVPAAALGDGTNITALSGNAVEVKFQGDGSVLDASNNPQNKAIFLYNSRDPGATAFAVSVLGAGGRIKLWKYNQNVNAYLE